MVEMSCRQLMLMAENSYYTSRFGYGNSHSLAFILVGLGLVVLVWVVMLNWEYIVEIVNSPSEKIDPLLEELSRVHRLSRSEMVMLQNAAGHLKLENPGELFVDPSLWIPGKETAFFMHPKMQGIYRVLFGVDPEAVS